MSRFYFHLKNRDGSYIRDEEGSEHPSLSNARDEAIEGARQIMSARVKEGRPANGSEFDIADEKGAIVLTVHFSEAISDDAPLEDPRKGRPA